MKSKELKLAKIVMLLSCWMILLTTGYSQTVDIVYNGPNCVGAGQAVTLSSNVTGLGNGGYLQCLKWKSSNPNEVIPQDWQGTVTVAPQGATTYTLCIMQGGTVVVSDTVTLKTNALEDFDLPCAMDSDGTIQIKDIPGIHKNIECLTGIVYSPSEISLGFNEGVKKWVVTASHNGKTFKDSIILIDSKFKLLGIEVSAGEKDITITVQRGASSYSESLNFAALDLAKILEKAIRQLPIAFSTDLSIQGKGSGSQNYVLCEGRTPCYGRSTNLSIGAEVKASAELRFNTPTVVAGLYATLNSSIAFSGTRDFTLECGKGNFCLSPNVTVIFGGTVGAQFGAGIIEVDGGIFGGGTGTARLCLSVPGIKDVDWGVKVGTTDLVFRGRVLLSWGFITREFNHVLIRGNPCLFEWPKVP